MEEKKKRRQKVALVIEEMKKQRQKVAPVKEERKKQLSLIPVPTLTAIKQVSY